MVMTFLRLKTFGLFFARKSEKFGKDLENWTKMVNKTAENTNLSGFF